MADIGDVIELIQDLPARGLRAGTQATIVHLHPEGAYEIEVSDEDGQALSMAAVEPDQFIVVWKSASKSWVPTDERVAALLRQLPEESGQEVLDFARFLSLRRAAAGS